MLSSQGFDVGSSREDEDEGRQERHVARHQAPEDRAERPWHALGVAPGAHEADELQHHDQRPGRGLGQGHTVDRLRRGDPSLSHGHGVGDIGEHGVGAAEGDQRRLGEEAIQLRVQAVPSPPRHQSHEWHDPERHAEPEHADGPPARWAGERSGGLVPALRAEDIRPFRGACQACRTGGRDDQRKGKVQEVHRDERRDSDRHVRAPTERPAPDSQDGEGHQGQHDRLETGEDADDGADVTVYRVGVRQAEEEKDRGQDEECPGHEPASRAVEQPSGVDRELMCLRAGQQHAVVEGVEEALLVEPSASLDQLPVHDRDLSRGAAERDEAQLRPEAGGLREGGRGRLSRHGPCATRARRPRASSP